MGGRRNVSLEGHETKEGVVAKVSEDWFDRDDLRLVAITYNGRAVTGRSQIDHPQKEQTLTTITTTLPGLTLKEIKKLNVERRPYDWVSFDYVAAQPVAGESQKPTTPDTHDVDSSTNVGKKADAQTSSPTPAVNPVAELKALQDQWKVVNIEKEKDAKFSLSGSSGQNGISVASVNRLKIGRDVVHFASFENWNAVTCFYRVGPTASPKTIDLYSSRSENIDGLLALGIYEMDGDNLKICLASYLPSQKTERRPKDFTIEPGSGKMVLTLQRYQPSADEKAIRGGWYFVEQIEDGKILASEGSKGNYALSFIDYYCHYESIGLGQKYIQSCIYVLDPDKEPKTIKIYPAIPRPGQVKPPEGIGNGIYKIDGERLWIAYRVGGPAPEKFESALGSGVTLIELQRNEPNPKGKAPSLNLPEKSVEMIIMQREEEAIPGSDGSVRIRLGDITGGQVLISVVTADKDYLLQRTSVSQGDRVGFSVGEKQYTIHVKELRNILIGEDFAKLVVSEAASDSTKEKRRSSDDINWSRKKKNKRKESYLAKPQRR